MLEEKLAQSRDLSDNIKKYAHLRIRARLIIYFLVAVSMIAIVSYDIADGNVRVLYSLSGIALGIIVGAIVSRMFHISWDEQAQMVISRLDTVGIIILVIYIAFEIYREVIIDQLVGHTSALAVSFSILAGIMIGRVLGIRRKIHRVLRENL